MNFTKNQLVTLEITDVSHEGEGVGKVDGFTFFVKDAIIGDSIVGRVTKLKKTYGYARLEERDELSFVRHTASVTRNRRIVCHVMYIF